MSFQVTVTPIIQDVEVSATTQPFEVEVNLIEGGQLELTTEGTSGDATYDPFSGILNIPNYTFDPSGYVPTSRELTINGVAFDLSANRAWTIPTHDAVTIGTANGLSLVGQILSLGLASNGVTGALSGVDWATFNGKEPAISAGTTAQYFRGDKTFQTLNASAVGASTVGGNVFGSANPSAITFLRANADNTVNWLSASDFRTAIGAQATLTNPVTGTGTSGQVAFWNGTSSQTGSATFAYTPTSQLLVNNSITASDAIARGANLTPSLTASANNDVLVGLDINPTFTNGAFTGVRNYALRSNGDIYFTSGNRTIGLEARLSTGNGGNLSIIAGNANTIGTGGNIFINPGSAAGGQSSGKIFLGNQHGWDGVNVTGIFTVNNSGPNTGDALRINAGGIRAFTIYWDNPTFFMGYGLVSGRQSRFYNSTSYTFDNNLIVGSNTDAGFRLDVNGTARVQGNLTTNLTAGSVPFIGASGLLSQNNANLFWDSANGRLGVGTNAPQGPLHINADITGATNGLTITRTGVALADANFQITNSTNLPGRFLPQFICNSNFLSDSITIGGIFSGRITNSNPNDMGLVFDARQKNNTALTQGYIASFRSFATDYVRIAHNGNMILQNGGTFTDAGFRLDVNGTARVQGKLSVNTPTAASAVMEVTSTTQGFLPPRMTTTQKNAIASPASGLVVYDTTLNQLSYYNSTTWINL